MDIDIELTDIDQLELEKGRADIVHGRVYRSNTVEMLLKHLDEPEHINGSPDAKLILIKQNEDLVCVFCGEVYDNGKEWFEAHKTFYLVDEIGADHVKRRGRKQLILRPVSHHYKCWYCGKDVIVDLHEFGIHGVNAVFSKKIAEVRNLG